MHNCSLTWNTFPQVSPENAWQSLLGSLEKPFLTPAGHLASSVPCVPTAPDTCPQKALVTMSCVAGMWGFPVRERPVYGTACVLQKGLEGGRKNTVASQYSWFTAIVGRICLRLTLSKLLRFP